MRAEFVNGATVHLIWPQLTDGKLIGAFRSYRDAARFCEGAVKFQEPGNKLIVVDHETGAMEIYRNPQKDRAKGAER